MTELNASQRLSGRVALVTGAASGIGRAITERLADDGATVVVTDVDSLKARQVAAAIDRNALAFGLDVTDETGFQAIVDSVVTRLGHLDVLVNNAGVAGRSAPLWELSAQEWRQVIDVNLFGVMNGCRVSVPTMRAQNYGRIVNIASIAGKEGNPNATHYSASKAGVIGLTKALAKEVVNDGIIVNCVTPAVIETDILKQLSQEHITYMLTRIPLGRMGKPYEVASLVAWLCSEECSFSTGAVFDISGGRATY